MKTEKPLTEAQEQKLFFKWARANQIKFPELQLIFSTLNGVRLAPRLRKEMKEQGNRAGVPDVFLPVSRNGWHGLFIELKRIKGGRLSNDQKNFLSLLVGQNYFAIVCRGHKEAIKAVKEYLKIV